MTELVIDGGTRLDIGLFRLDRPALASVPRAQRGTQ
jgi:hypothetical protein